MVNCDPPSLHAVWYEVPQTAPQVLAVDPHAGTGSRYRVLTRAADTAGTSFTVEILNKPGAPGFVPGLSASIPEHSHTGGQEEQLTVLKGKLGYVLRDVRMGFLEPGDTLSIPAGAGPTSQQHTENSWG